MNAEILSIKPIAIEKIQEKHATPLKDKKENILPRTTSQQNRRFGTVDLWAIRRTKRHFTYYR